MQQFNQETHGSSGHRKDEIFIEGGADFYVPLSYLTKNIEGLDSERQLQILGYTYAAHDFIEKSGFAQWYEKQFSKKLTAKQMKSVSLLHLPDELQVFSAIKKIDEAYEELRRAHVLINSKNPPVQLGEWYAKSIFGLRQVRASSQKGFEFKLLNEFVSVNVVWGKCSPKGIKFRKSTLESSRYCVVFFLLKNLMIRDLCFLDSDYLLRHFSGKGMSLFLKESDIASYHFSKSSKHYDKVVGKNTLLKYASPNLATQLVGNL